MFPRVFFLFFDRHGDLRDVVTAVFAAVGRAFQINRAERTRGFDVVFFHVCHQRQRSRAHFFIRTAVVNAKRGRLREFHTLFAVITVFNGDTADEVFSARCRYQ